MDTKPTQTYLADKSRWQEAYAYNLGLQAYIWAYPWLYFGLQSFLWSGNPEVLKKLPRDIVNRATPWAAMNTFYRKSALSTPESSSSQTPNCDTLYSYAWLDLSEEPLVLTIPTTEDARRMLYVIQLAGMDSDNFGYVSTQATGYVPSPDNPDLAHYLIAYKDWHGTVPANVFDINLRAPTPTAFVLARTGVNVPKKIHPSGRDLQTAQTLQQQYALTPLSNFISPRKPAPAPIYAPDVPALRFEPTPETALDHWRTINQTLTANPPSSPPDLSQDSMLAQFARIGIGPNCNIDDMPEPIRLGLQRAAVDGYKFIRSSQKYLGTPVGGWSYPTKHIGRAGVSGEYLSRASIQALWGLVSEDPAEAVYINTFLDADGNPLTGENTYIMELASMPPFNSDAFGFWSITLYNKDYHLVPDSAEGHYSINSYHTILPVAADRSPVIRIQKSAPEKTVPGEFWLQSPTPVDGDDGQFYLVLRVYAPAAAIRTTQSWLPPKIIRTNG